MGELVAWLKEPSACPRCTEISWLEKFVMQTSSLPSPLKSPAATAPGKSPPPSLSLWPPNVPSPFPRITEIFPPGLPKRSPTPPDNPPGRSVATTSSFPSLLKSPTATAVVRFPPVENAEPELGANVPSPLPSRMDTELSVEFAIARSRMPSLLKSPMVTETGASPTPVTTGEPGAARNEDFRLMLKPTAPLIASTKTKVRLAVNRLMLAFPTMLPIFIFNLSSQPLGVRLANKLSADLSHSRTHSESRLR